MAMFLYARGFPNAGDINFALAMLKLRRALRHESDPDDRTPRRAFSGRSQVDRIVLCGEAFLHLGWTLTAEWLPVPGGLVESTQSVGRTGRHTDRIATEGP